MMTSPCTPTPLCDCPARARAAVAATSSALLARHGGSRRAATPAAAQAQADALVSEAFDLSYNLDHDPAIAKLTEGAKQYPQHTGIQRALATMTWLHLLFTRGQVLVDDYLGPVSRQNVKIDPAPPEVSKAFNTYLARALTLANRARDEVAAGCGRRTTSWARRSGCRPRGPRRSKAA